MKKDEIKKLILECKTQDDIKNFVIKRLGELEDNSIETTMGQGYTDTFKDFISSKIHYKANAKIGVQDSPDLMYDDETPYIMLVKELLRKGNYNELTLFSDVYFLLYNYLPNNGDFGIERFWVYKAGLENGSISIKDIIQNTCAFCSEKAGLAHNLFKFLGIDSELIVGTRNKNNHAYNIIYPNGYEKEPAVIYDPSFHIDYINKSNRKISFGYFIPLIQEEHLDIVNGTSINLNIQRSAKKIEGTYGWNGALDDYEVVSEDVSYGIGLNKTRNIRSIISNSDKSDPRS